MATSMPSTMQLIKSERHAFSASDDSAVTKIIQASHAPDGRQVAVRPLLLIIQAIFRLASPTVLMAPQEKLEELEEQATHIIMLEALAFTIHKLAREISCKCSGSGDAHAQTLVLFNTLPSYTWDAKVVLALAAFATSYGEFWLTAQLHTINPLAKSVALLKQLPDVLEYNNSLRPCLEALNSLVKGMIDVTMCIIELMELPSDYISPDTLPGSLAIAHIPTAVYWTFRSILACTSQIMGLIGMGHEYVAATTEAWELSVLAHKVSNIHEYLRKQLAQCYQHIDEQKQIEVYHTLERLFKMEHIDNMKNLKELISYKDDMPIIDAITKKRVSAEVLRRKIVVLFISDLNVSHEELAALTKIYNDINHGKIERQFEIVWLPVIEKSVVWDNAKQEQFANLANSMPWYSLYHPSLLDPGVIGFIKKEWKFKQKPLSVVLDAQGRVSCHNALHMMWIWGSLAFPFTSLREEALWQGKMWGLKLLVDEFDPTILQWIREERFICLYGGENIDWIRSFTTSMKRVAQEAQIPIKMLYVGKSNPKERVRKIITLISDEKLSETWHDLFMMWLFWVRLQSMYYYKTEHRAEQGQNIDFDPIVQEVGMMLHFDSRNQGWVVIGKGGSTEMDSIVKANGKEIIDSLAKFDEWKADIKDVGFIVALMNEIASSDDSKHCTHMILPWTTGQIQNKVPCCICKSPMEKCILYRCCND